MIRSQTIQVKDRQWDGRKEKDATVAAKQVGAWGESGGGKEKAGVIIHPLCSRLETALRPIVLSFLVF